MKLFIYFLALVVPAMTYSNVDLLRQANDFFTTQMFQNVVRNNPGENIVISAFSVLSPLAQLCLASVGPSHDELLRAIGLPNDNAILEQFSNLTYHLQNLNSVELNLANKIYIRPYEPLNARFAAISKDVFNSEVQNIDFSRQNEAADIINSWVEQKTNHRIKQLVSPNMLSASTAAVLVNALYFKGNWVNQFEQIPHLLEDFYVSEGRTINIPTMFQRSGFHYGESVELDAKLLRMYFQGYRSSFLIILPNRIEGLGSLIGNLRDSTAISRAVSNMQYDPDIAVRIPKFKIETTTDLKKVLKNMNIVKLFISGQARLERLLNNQSNMHISAAIQKAYIDVNENGVEAAAANAFILAGLSGGYNPPHKTFVADRPFYFALLIDNMIAFSGVFTH